MPSRLPLPADSRHPVAWDWGASAEVMRGHPVPMDWWQRRPPGGPKPTPMPVPVLLHHRPYDRGAAAFTPKFGVLYTNPIGAAYVTPWRIPTIAGPGARYVFGAIWFDPQVVDTSMRFNPTVPIESVDALIASSRVGPSYRTTG